MNKSIILSAQILPDKFDLFEINSDAKLLKILPSILSSLVPEGQSAELKDYRVLIAHQVANLENPVSQETVNASSAVETQLITTRDLKLQNGFYILFVKLPVASSRLTLLHAGSPLVTLTGIEKFLIGRKDESRNIYPDVDLTSYLGEYENKISRQQAVIFADKEKWKIKVHPEARSPIYVDQIRLEPGSEYEVRTNTVINFGSNPAAPLLSISARIEPN